MQFEKIRRINKSKVFIRGVVALGVISTICILPSFAKYKLTQSINIAEGVVNYKIPDLKIMAMYQQNAAGTYDEVTTMPTSGYTINEDNTYCTTDNVNKVKGKIKTENGQVTLKNLAKGDKCYLYFDKKTTIEMGNMEVKFKDTIPTFSNVATTDEGVYKVSDGMYGGYSYYWRGAVTNNYVEFAGFCWRIIRINGDGSIRLIYDGTTCHANGTSTTESIAVTSQKYNSSSDRSEYVGYTYIIGNQRTLGGTASNLKTQTDSWYTTNIIDKGYDAKVATGKFCNDRNIASGSTWSSQSSAFQYATYERLNNAKAPILSCKNSGDIYSLKSGAITADEISLAGGVVKKENNSYYLYNGQNYWTMSPYVWNKTYTYAYMYYMYINGSLNGNASTNSGAVYHSYGIRPVINLLSNTQFKSGTDGTLNNPYEVI